MRRVKQQVHCGGRGPGASYAAVLLRLFTLLLLICLALAPQAGRALDDWDTPPKPRPQKPRDADKKGDDAKDADKKDADKKDADKKDDKGSGEEKPAETPAETSTEAPSEAPADAPADVPGDDAASDEGQAPENAAASPDENSGDGNTGGSDSGGMFLDIATFDEVKAEEAQDAGAEGAEGQDTTPIRRPRPRTAEQERTWKLARTREDPFLNPPGGELGEGIKPGSEIYRPTDWLSQELPEDYSLYLVQDARGQLKGSLSLAVQIRKDEKGQALVVLTRTTDYGMAARTEVLSSLEGLRPRLIQRDAIELPDGAAQQEGDMIQDNGLLPVPHLRVEYFYDRVTIVRDAGDVASHDRMRALPFSFDVQQMPLIMRLLNYSAKQWPFEAYITLPEERSSAPLVINAAGLQNQLSAEGEKVPCYHVEAQIGKQKWEWWVQKGAPHRLIRFSDGELTYTLSEYNRSSRGGY
ncbi:hypothetical protein IT575_03430 [bacterium]|nr:hypothetical protein [bacterium]